MKAWPVICLFSLLAVSRGADPRAAPKAGKAAPLMAGVVVETVADGSPAAAAGIRRGDNLLSWGAPTPAGAEAAEGAIASPFDLEGALLEFGTRGEIRLSGKRGKEALQWVIRGGEAGMKVRPDLPPDLLARYEQGLTLAESGDTARAAALLRGEAGKLTARAPITFCWLMHESGGLLAVSEQWKEAESDWTSALDAASACADEAVQTFILMDLGGARSAQDDFGGALEHYRRALGLLDLVSPGGVRAAVCLMKMGQAEYERGDMGASRSRFQAALENLDTAAPQSRQTAMTLNNLSDLARDRGDLQAAEAYNRRSLAILETISPGGFEVAICLNGLGVIARHRGDLASAETHYSRGLAILERLDPESPATAKTLNNLAVVYFDRGDLETAEDLFKKSLAIKEKKAPGTLSVAMGYGNLGSLFREKYDRDLAESYYRKALEIQKRLVPKSMGTAMTLSNLGTLEIDRGRYDSAEALFNQSLAIKEESAPGSLSCAVTYTALGSTALALGDLDGAEKNFRKSLAARSKLAPGSGTEAEGLYDVGRVLSKRGDLASALRFFKDAAIALDSQRGKLGGGAGARESFSTIFADYYRDLIETQVELGQAGDAFHTLERYRARALLEMLAERDLDFARDVPAELLLEQKRLASEGEGIEDELGGLNPETDGARIEELLGRLRDLRREQGLLREKTKAASPALASLQYPEALDLAGARSVLEPGVLFLSYSVGEKRTVLFALLDGGFGVFSIPVAREELGRTVVSYRALLMDPRSERARLSEKGMALYGMLLKPAQGFVGRAKAILIAPDGPLHGLPFPALQVKRGRYLVEERPVACVTSASLYAEIRLAAPPRTGGPEIAAFGNPPYPEGESLPGGGSPWGYPFRVSPAPLPASLDEVESICGMFPGRALRFLGEGATEENARSLGSDVRRIHFACHGHIDPRFPLESGLILAPPAEASGRANGFLQAWEILEGVRLGADLVTLSACETGLGKEMGGEGLIGLTRAFQYAGARSVLASLWSVSDESTAELMKLFYGHLKEGKPKAEALRLAQVEMICGFVGGVSRRRSNRLPAPQSKALPQAAGLETAPTEEKSPRGSHLQMATAPRSKADRGLETAPTRDFSHPFYWAGFVLNGDWK